MSNTINLNESWKTYLIDEFKKKYMIDLRQFLFDELKKQKSIYPKPNEYFEAFNLTPFEKVKICILGQDPYHGVGQAHGLSFSVKKNITTPPSLVNIYKELKNDLAVPVCSHGFLNNWAEEGILLLNSSLTVEAHKPASHRDKGWEVFTDQVISQLSLKRVHLVFFLWGNFAIKKRNLIDEQKHLILTAPHPSPLSAHRGFFGCKHFSKANDYLISKNLTPPDWFSHLKEN